MSKIIDMFKFKKVKVIEVSEPRKPTIQDIIDMYEMGVMTAEESIDHLNEQGYLHRLLMKAIIQSRE